MPTAAPTTPDAPRACALCRSAGPGACLAAERRRPEQGRHRLDAHLHRAGAAHVGPGAGALLRRPGAHQEHALGAHAGVRRLLADHGAVVHLRLLDRLHAGQCGDRGLRAGCSSPAPSIQKPALFATSRPTPAAPRCTSSCTSAFQATFAAITCCLILGSVVERISSPRCSCSSSSGSPSATARSRTWCGTGRGRMPTPAPDRESGCHATGGLIWQWGALDFAGGTVVHINAGVAGLVGAFVLGQAASASAASPWRRTA